MSEPVRPIVALHGNLGSPADWEALSLPGLRAIDLWECASLSLIEFADELAGDMTLGMEQPILAGYSLGGRLALQAMARHPERWGGAVIISAHPGLCCVEDRLARRISDEVWARHARDLEWTDFIDKWNHQPVLGGSSPSPFQLALESRREAIARAFESWSLGRQEDLRTSLGGFKAPVLWVTGERDKKFTDLGAEMSEVLVNSHQVIIPDCGHRVLSEAPDELEKIIRTIGET